MPALPQAISEWQSACCLKVARLKPLFCEEDLCKPVQGNFQF